MVGIESLSARSSGSMSPVPRLHVAGVEHRVRATLHSLLDTSMRASSASTAEPRASTARGPPHGSESEPRSGASAGDLEQLIMGAAVASIPRFDGSALQQREACTSAARLLASRSKVKIGEH